MYAYCVRELSQCINMSKIEQTERKVKVHFQNFAEAKSILEVKLQRSRKADFRGAASMIELRVQM